MSVSAAQKIFDVPIQQMMYNPIQINSLIHSIKMGAKKLQKNPVIVQELQYHTYNYYLYNLLILQFIYIFNKQRNLPLRKELIAVLVKSDFTTNSKQMNAVHEIINKIEDVEDVHKLKTIISRYISQHHDKKQLIEDITTGYFNFDKVLLDKLKHMEYDKVLAELHNMAKKFVKIGDVTKVKKFRFPNMLISCDQAIKISKKSESIGYCSENKFIIKKNQLDEMLSILAYDVINPSKWKWLFNNVFIEKSVDFFRFIRRPNETITVEFLS
jgi:SepF-like predicted cell division protein (DUF552 family)